MDRNWKLHRLSEHERRATAYHEAGHVVVGIIFGRDPLSSTIQPDGKGQLGKTEFDETPDFAKRGPDSWPAQRYRHYIRGRVVGQLAGTTATAKALGEGRTRQILSALKESAPYRR